MMTDYRCPVCNCITKGREEITGGKPRTPLTECPKCKTPLKLESQTDDLGLCYSYNVVKEQP